MIIKKAQIYGFGKWIDEEIVFPEGKLVCIYGENESGKSSLYHFLIYILFGNINKEFDFQPRRGSVLGGKVLVEDRDYGSFFIERREGVRRSRALCTFPNGEERDEDWLQSYLKGMDFDLFQRIFSYSTKDLFEIHLAKKENLGDVLLNIGLTGYSNLHELEKNIERQRENLFKPQGSVPILNKAFQSFDVQEKKLLEIRNEVSRYKPKQERHQFLSKKIISLENEYSQMQSEYSEIEKKLHNYQTIYKYFLRKKELSNFKEEIVFPKKGLERLQQVKDQKHPIKSELKLLKNNLETVELEIEKINDQLAKRIDLEQVEETLGEKENYRELTREVEKLEREISGLKDETERALQEMNIPLDYEILEKMTFPFYLEGVWEEINKSLTDILQEQKNAENQLHTITLQKDQVKGEVAKLEQGLLSEDERRAYEISLEEVEQYNEERRRQGQKEKWLVYREKGLRRQKVLLLGSTISFLLLLLAGYILDQAVLYLIAAIIVIFGTSQYFFSRQALDQTARLFQAEEKDLAPIDLNQIQEIRKLLAQEEELRDELRFLNQRSKQLAMEEQEIKLQLESIAGRTREVDEKIQGEIQSYPFLEPLEVRFWPEIYSRLQQFLANIKRINHLKAERKQEEQLRSKLETRIRKVYQAAFDSAETREIETIFQALQSYQDEINRLKIEREGKLTSHNKLLEEIKSVKIRLQDVKEEEASLFAKAKVKTEEEFFQREEKHRKQREVLTSLEQLNNQLTLIFQDDRYKQFDLRKETESYLEGRLSQKKSKLEDLEKEMLKVRKELTELDLILRNLESSESYSEAMQRRAIEKGNLEKLAWDWSVLQIAEDLLEKTKRTYQQKYLRDVLEIAQQFFQEITQGGYSKIFPPSAAEDLRVQSREGESFEVGHLSQGTIEQLYISLKLALASLFSEQYRLPFMIDDAFIHFDEERLKQILNLVMRLSKDKQIFLFTCKQEMVEKINPQHIIKLKGEGDE